MEMAYVEQTTSLRLRLDTYSPYTLVARLTLLTK